MNDYLKIGQDLEQKVESERAKEPTIPEPRIIYVQKKSGLGKKFLIGTGITLAGTLIAANEARKRIWKFFNPPSFKKYFALAAMAVTFYGATHCNDVSKGANTIYNKAKEQVSIVNYKNEQIKTLNQRLEELTSNLSTDLAARIQSFGNRISSNYSYIIYVDKQENKLSLFEKDQGKFRLAKSYNCSTGINPSQKTKQGDKATPEGIFKFTYRNFETGIPPLYGRGMIGTECPGIVLCGAILPERIRAIETGEGCTNGGIITKDQALVEIDNKLGHYWGQALLVSENPSRPVMK